MRNLLLISALLFSFNGWAEEIAIKCETDLDYKPYTYQIINMSDSVIKRFKISDNNWHTYAINIRPKWISWTQIQAGSPDGEDFMNTTYSIDRESLLINWQSTLADRLILGKQTRKCEILSIQEIESQINQVIKESISNNKF